MGFRTRIPLPKAPAGSVPEGMATVNALNKGFVDAAMEPYTLGSNALSKMAYANWIGPTVLSQSMRDPSFRTATKAEQNAIVNAYRKEIGQAIGSGDMSSYGLGKRPQGMSVFGSSGGTGGLFSGIGNALRNLFGSGESTQAAPSQFTQQPANASQGVSDQGNVVATPQEIAQGADAPMDESQVPASTGGETSPQLQTAKQKLGMAESPSATAVDVGEAEAAGLKAGTTAEKQQQAKDWSKWREDNSPLAEVAKVKDELINQMIAARKQLKFYEQGPFFGNVPALSDARQNLQQAATNYVNFVAKEMAKGGKGVTQQELQAAKMSKPSELLAEGPFWDNIARVKKDNDRLMNRLRHYNKSERSGKSIAQADTDWMKKVLSQPNTPEKIKQLRGLGWVEMRDEDGNGHIVDPKSVKKKIKNGWVIVMNMNKGTAK